MIWGGLHGVYQVGAGLRDKWLGGTGSHRQATPTATQRAGFALSGRLWHVGNVLVTFVLVMLTWVFFRATSVGSAWLILKKIGTLSPTDPVQSPLNVTEMWFSVGLIGLLLVKEATYLTIPTHSTPRFFALFGLLLFVTYLFGVVHLQSVHLFPVLRNSAVVTHSDSGTLSASAAYILCVVDSSNDRFISFFLGSVYLK